MFAFVRPRVMGEDFGVDFCVLPAARGLGASVPTLPLAQHVAKCPRSTSARAAALAATRVHPRRSKELLQGFALFVQHALHGLRDSSVDDLSRHDSSTSLGLRLPPLLPLESNISRLLRSDLSFDLILDLRRCQVRVRLPAFVSSVSFPARRAALSSTSTSSPFTL